MKKFVMLGLIVGSTIGGFVPALWGGSTFSMTGVFFSTLGGIIGIWGGYTLGQ